MTSVFNCHWMGYFKVGVGFNDGDEGLEIEICRQWPVSSFDCLLTRKDGLSLKVNDILYQLKREETRNIDRQIENRQTARYEREHKM